MMDADIYGIVSMLNGTKDPQNKGPFCFHWEGEVEDSDWNKRTSDDLIEWNGKTLFSRSYAEDDPHKTPKASQWLDFIPIKYIYIGQLRLNSSHEFEHSAVAVVVDITNSPHAMKPKLRLRLPFRLQRGPLDLWQAKSMVEGATQETEDGLHKTPKASQCFFFLAMMDADIYGIVSMLNGTKDPQNKGPLASTGMGEGEGQRLEQRTSDDLIEWNGKTLFSRSYAGDRR
ncbi:hypothetical protein CEXT_573081 [Caerostris extrusa]|uniref:Uncharacterized protein n=1 Tax=Caerostris extrusa TaxID=172846 RepID=A0AAV4WNH2_CAEEX|nr:hypothetical protein CEXT_573081 [Caerostris extrusa]